MINKESSFFLLERSIQRWVWQQEWTSLNEVQEKAIPIILRRDSDVIISAATAGGKTEAAFLPIISSIVKENTIGCKVLYVSPLKALINDQYRRLSDLARVAKTSVTPWHQDIPASKKAHFLECPSDILIITPESLESFLINRREYAEIIFSSLKYVVVDELHAFMGTERGKQLQSLLSRVELISSREIPRIAMSATFSDFDNVVKYLRGNRRINCNIIKQEHSSHEIGVVIKEYINSKDANVTDDISNEIISKLRGSNNLVFVNKKIEAEVYAVNLKELCEAYNLPNEFRIHHGNLSREIRERVERELQKGLYPITAICTSTMELGVDIGKVKSIAQIEVANSVSSLRQRLGRSGRRNEPSYLRIFSIDDECGEPLSLRENLFQNIAVVELLKEKSYEPVKLNRFHLSTLAHQLLSLIASYGSISPQEAWVVLCVKGAFNNVDSITFGQLLRSLGAKGAISQMHTGELVMGKEGENIIKQPDFYAVFHATEEYTVIDISGGRVGFIQDLPEIKTVITLGARFWIVENIDIRSKVIYVSLANERGKYLFSGCPCKISPLITRKIKEIYCCDDNYPYLDVKAQAELLVGRQCFHMNQLAHNHFLQLEEQSVLFTWAGGIVNHTIELIAACYLGISVDGDNPLYVCNIGKDDVAKILEMGKPDAAQLASVLEYQCKLQEKYDYLLSEELLNISYAQSNVDVDGAWCVLEGSLYN